MMEAWRRMWPQSDQRRPSPTPPHFALMQNPSCRSEGHLSDFNAIGMNCQKNAVVCEGYPEKIVWKSGRQKAEEGMEARRHTDKDHGAKFVIN